MRRLGRTRPFRGPDGTAITDSIAEVKFVRLGGIEQWVLMRGQSVANPPLIILHGGPGFSDTQFFFRFNAPLEQDFIVVYWDQRGTGKSFDSKIPKSSMTVEQFIADLDDLVEAVRRRVGQEKVVIFGHSWGSALGPLYTSRFPDKVSAYVGSGQLGSWPDSEAATYAYALDKAERTNNRKALEALRKIGPPPHTADKLWTQRMWLNRLDGQINVKTTLALLRLFLGRPELSLLDLPSLYRGFRFSIGAMWEEVSKINLLEAVPSLDVPVFFFQGRNDHWVPPEITEAYFDVLIAPSKRLVWFEESGHEPFADEPAKFNALMSELVRPVAIGE